MSFCNVSMNLLGIPLSAPPPVGPPELASWIMRSVPTAAQSVRLNGIACSPSGIVVATGSDSPTIHTVLSNDGGVNWSYNSYSVTGHSHERIAYSGGVWFFRGGESTTTYLWGSATSSNGSTWNLSNANAYLYSANIAVSWSMLFGLWYNSDIRYSSDWFSWVQHSTWINRNGESRIIIPTTWTYANRGVVYFNDTSTTTQIYKSNGSLGTYSPKSTWNYAFRSMAYGNNTFVGFGKGTDWYSRSFHSTDGGDTFVPWDVIGFGNYITSFGNGMFIAISQNDASWLYSYDGIVWTNAGVLPLAPSSFNPSEIQYVDTGTVKRFVVISNSTASTTNRIATVDFV